MHKNNYNPIAFYRALSAMMTNKQPLHFIGESTVRPHPRPQNQRQLWKTRRQHGTGKGVK